MPTELSPRATEIADLTVVLLARGGYNGFSYADISERVNIGKASIHHHFPSKAELVLTVVQRYRAQIREGLATLDSRMDDPRMKLAAYIRYWSDCIRDGLTPICICAMLAAELPAIPADVADEVRDHFRQLAAWLASVFAAGAAQGRLDFQGSAEAQADAFMATVHGAMLSARALGNPDAFDAVTQATLQRLTSGH